MRVSLYNKGLEVRVAMREGSGALYYLFGDHGSAALTTSLGSTSLSYNAATAATIRTLYHPLRQGFDKLNLPAQGGAWGTVRWTSGSLPTDYTFTGQYSYASDFGLMFYVARWYDPSLGRFAQADSIVPGAGNPIAWDRYHYSLNNPIRFIDPSGHGACDGTNRVPECDEIDPDGDGQVPLLQPWESDPDAKDSWGDPTGTNHPWRAERAQRVWNWICETGGWWGIGCPGAYDLTAWLLNQELGILLRYPVSLATNAQNALVAVITYMRDLFSNGIDPATDLAKFTAFFNPNSGRSFDVGDWDELMVKPPGASYNALKTSWEQPNPYPGRHVVWRTPGELNGPGFSQHLFDVKHPIDGYVILQFGLR